MLLNLIITGVGGQGNVLASRILGRAAVDEGYRVTIGETFGLSQRGGPVMSHVRIYRGKEYGPIIPPNQAHVVIGLEPLETLRILADYADESTVFVVNSRPIYPLNVIAGESAYPDPGWIQGVLNQVVRRAYWLEATETAVELGGPIMLNMIMLGALCALPEFPIKAEALKQTLGDIFPEDKLAPNYRALDTGADMIARYED